MQLPCNLLQFLSNPSISLSLEVYVKWENVLRSFFLPRNCSLFPKRNYVFYVLCKALCKGAQSEADSILSRFWIYPRQNLCRQLYSFSLTILIVHVWLFLEKIYLAGAWYFVSIDVHCSMMILFCYFCPVAIHS